MATLARTRILRSDDPATTLGLAARLGALARAGDVVCLHGDLGTGKTVFAKGFGRGLGVEEPMASPSFILMAEHEGRLPLFHLDLYRLHDAREAIEGGLLDEREVDGVTVIEWADRLGEALPASRLDVVIEGSGDEPRTLRFKATDERHARYLEALP